MSETSTYGTLDDVDYAVLDCPSIKLNEGALRKVDTTNPKYQLLVRQIGETGLIQPIQVNRTFDSAGNAIYTVINGAHRLQAHIDLGKPEIKTMVYKNLDPELILIMQFAANGQVIETTPAQYVAAIKRLSRCQRAFTGPDLAAKLGINPEQINNALRLMNLDPDILAQVETGLIPLNKAEALAGIPDHASQRGMVASLTQSTAKDFAAACKLEAQRVRKELAAGKDPSAEKRGYVHVPAARRTADIKELVDHPEKIGAIFGEPTDVVSAIIAALEWAIQCDPESKAAKLKKYEDHQAALQAQRDQQKAAREQRAAEKAAALEAALSSAQ